MLVASQGEPEGRVDVSGLIVEGGVECPILQAADGQNYALQGVTPGETPVGTKVRVRGTFVELSTCQQGQAIRVDEIIE